MGVLVEGDGCVALCVLQVAILDMGSIDSHELAHRVISEDLCVDTAADHVIWRRSQRHRQLLVRTDPFLVLLVENLFRKNLLEDAVAVSDVRGDRELALGYQ